MAAKRLNLVMLAAGFATRLEPKALNTPKHLLHISKGKVLMDLFWESVLPCLGEFSKVVLATNHKYKPLFSQWATKTSPKIQLLDNGISSQEDKIGAVGDLLFALREGRIKGDVVVCAPDYIIPDAAFSGFIRFAREKNSSATIAKVELDKSALRAGSCLELNSKGFVTRFEEKPSWPFSNLYGVPYYYLLEKDIKYLSDIPPGLRDNIGQVVAKLVSSSMIAARPYRGKVIHLTSERDYLKLVSAGVC